MQLSQLPNVWNGMESAPPCQHMRHMIIRDHKVRNMCFMCAAALLILQIVVTLHALVQ